MNLQENIQRIKELINLHESMKIDDFGRLHDEDTKLLYPHTKIRNFIDWFQKEYGDYVSKQGWGIFDSETELPHIKYKFERDNKFMSTFQVQKIDLPEDDEAILGELENDNEAYELAEKLGLILDEFGVVIGWDGELFI